MSPTHNEDYLACLDQLRRIDRGRCAAVLGLETESDDLTIPYYGEVYRLSQGAFLGRQGEPPTDAVGLVLGRYLLNCPDDPLPVGGRLTFRELDGAGPLVSSFANNTNKLIAGAFAQDAQALESAGRRMNGARCDGPPGYDLVLMFSALPRVPLFLHFNAADDLFPAQCSLLFDHFVQGYLDMQSLFILGTYLAGGLVRHGTSATT